MFLAFPLNLDDLQNAILNSNLTEKDYDSHDFFILKTCITLLSSMQDLIDQIEMGEGFSVHCEKEWSQFIKYYNKTYKRAKKIFHRYLKRLKIDYWEQEELVRNILWVTKLINSGFYDNDDEDVYFHAIILSGKFLLQFFTIIISLMRPVTERLIHLKAFLTLEKIYLPSKTKGYGLKKPTIS